MMNNTIPNDPIISYEHNFEIVADSSRNLARYLVFLRGQFQSNAKVHSILKEDISKEAKLSRIREVVEYNPEDPDQYDTAISTLIDELSSLLATEPSNYLVDSATGQIIKALDDGDIFTPPDYVGEDGQLHKSQPKVHPKISLSLASAKISLHRNRELKELAERPEYQQTFAHLRDPQLIVENTIRLLENNGYQVQENDGEKVALTFGREVSGTRMQSVNPRFNRLNTYSSVLATKIMKLVSKNDQVWITNFKFTQTAKYIFYTVDVYYKHVNALTE